MRSFPVQDYLIFVRNFQRLISEEGPEDHEPLSEEDAAREARAMLAFARDFEKFSLRLTAAQLRRMASECEAGRTRSDVNAMIPAMFDRLEDECRDRLMLMVEPDYVKYIENPQFFDSSEKGAKKVSAAFPSAGEDIAESGICLALSRPTACVMHLARVLESGLSALAKELGVSKQNDWGHYLGEIDKELQRRAKVSGARSPDEQFYAEAHATFDSVRRAWRNPTMHIDKTYTGERAEEILGTVRTFMRHLATRLEE